MKSIFILRKEPKPEPLKRAMNSRLFNSAWLMLLLLSLTMWQCKNDDYVETTGVCPEVISTVATNNAVNVVALEPITVTFNEKMNASTMSASTFLLTSGTNAVSGLKQAAAPVTGTVTPATGETDTFTFTPSSPLAPFTLYTGTIKKGVKDPMNNALQEDYVWSFTTQPLATLSANPVLGGITSGGGLYDTGTQVTANVVPNAGYVFANWTENGVEVSTETNYQFEIGGNSTLVANFTAQYTVTLSSLPLAGGTTTGGGSFNSGASVTVGAVPAIGFTFTNWTEGTNIVSSNANYTFNLTANKTFVANFAPVVAEQFNVSLSSNPLLGGTTTGGGSFNSGASVTVGAVPAVGFTFTNWTEGTNIVSSNANYTFNLTANKTFVANFEPDVILPSGPAPIDLGSAGDFAVLAGAGVSNTGVTTMINGDVGSFPTATINGLLAGNVNGTLYMTADPIVGLAKTDLTTAYNDGQARSLDAISLPGQIGGLTLAPGLYVNGSTSGISGTGPNGILTLDAGGNANAVWIFKMASTFVTDAGTSIVLAGGAQAKNIFWSVGSSATLGTNSIFYGTILADQAITLTTGATLYGRALTRIAAVTLDSNTVTKP